MQGSTQRVLPVRLDPGEQRQSFAEQFTAPGHVQLLIGAPRLLEELALTVDASQAREIDNILGRLPVTILEKLEYDNIWHTFYGRIGYERV